MDIRGSSLSYEGLQRQQVCFGTTRWISVERPACCGGGGFVAVVMGGRGLRALLAL